MILQEPELQSTTRDYLKKEWDDERLKNSVGITLTMKQGNRSVRLDPIRSETNFYHFMKRLEKKTFGKSGERYKKEIKRFPVLEFTNSRYHYHLLMEIPKFSNGNRIEKEKFFELINDSWKKTEFGYEQIHIIDFSLSDGNRWRSYITKFQSSENNRVDWGNVR
jgi:hypothetical protein